MRVFLFLILMLQVGCATKYIIAGNRFITPETHGGNLRSQIELQAATANQLTVRTDQAGVNTVATNRTGFLFETSLFEAFDFFWAHTGGANSMVGGKFQFMGTSRASGTGHKMAIAGCFGGNEHEIDGDPTVEFEMTGREFLLLYGYRFSPYVMPYASFSKAVYHFNASLKSSDSTINGMKPDNTTDAIGFYGGTEIDVGNFLGKLECGYQRLSTTATKNFINTFCGYSVGYHW